MTEQKKQEIRRLEKLHGVKVGERVKLRIQVYERFVVIKTSFGTHPSYFWSDFEKWRVE